MTPDNLESLPFMKSLTRCLKKMILEGYTVDFKVAGNGLTAGQNSGKYSPEEIQVVNSFRFETPSEPNDNAILYVIETNDGTRGTMIDSNSARGHETVSQFMKDVESYRKM